MKWLFFALTIVLLIWVVIGWFNTNAIDYGVLGCSLADLALFETHDLRDDMKKHAH